MTAAHGKKSRSPAKARPRSLSVYAGRTAIGHVLEHAPEDWEARTVKGSSIGHFPNCKAAADAVSDASAGRADGPARKSRRAAPKRSSSQSGSKTVSERV
jgi:hypothetical protein